MPTFKPWTLGCFLSASLIAGCGTPTASESKGGDSSSAPNKKDSSTAPKSEGSKGPKDENDEKDKPGDGESSKGKKDKPGNPDDESDPGKDDGSENDPKFDVGADPDDKPKEEIGCDIDFLFIVDNSVSMKDNQKSLANSVPNFIQTIKDEIPLLETYHIGVISTDENRFNGTDGSKNCATMGGLVTRTVDYSEYPFENICTPYSTEKNFMSVDDDLTKKFSCAAKMGAMGSGNERPMDAIQRAMSSDLTKKGECNDGFFRKNAILVVVLITDEEDDIEIEDGQENGSKGDPKDWYDAVLKFKGNRPEYVVMLSLLGKPKPNACDYTYEPGGEPKDGEGIKSAEVSKRLIEFTNKFGKNGVVGDVCADNYGDFFKKAVGVIKLSCDEAPR